MPGNGKPSEAGTAAGRRGMLYILNNINSLPENVEPWKWHCRACWYKLLGHCAIPSRYHTCCRTSLLCRVCMGMYICLGAFCFEPQGRYICTIWSSEVLNKTTIWQLSLCHFQSSLKTWKESDTIFQMVMRKKKKKRVWKGFIILHHKHGETMSECYSLEGSKAD